MVFRLAEPMRRRGGICAAEGSRGGFPGFLRGGDRGPPGFAKKVLDKRGKAWYHATTYEKGLFFCACITVIPAQTLDPLRDIGRQ